MAFKKVPPPAIIPDSPEKILLDLPRRKIPGVLLHQGEVMRKYAEQAVDVPDVALQLPTGSGKTLVGLMIGEWRRRKSRERIVYLCPTRQLVNQVVEQADEQYGLAVNGFTGPIAKYSPQAKTEYKNADRIAVTTYSSLFNTNPFFDDAEVILVDDTHAAENYIASLWTLRIERREAEHSNLHAAVSFVLRPLLDAVNYTRMTGQWEGPADATWVDKIPTPDFAQIADEFAAVIDAHVGNTKLRYSWEMLRDHLHACHLYVSSQDILLRPLIPPTWTHTPFSDAKQRIFMSATLGAGGDLERLTGRKNIFRLPVPEGWDRQGIGRRFFVFPTMSLKDDDVDVLRRNIITRAGRSVVLVPSDQAREVIAQDVEENLGFPVFGAEQIEASKKPFVSSPHAVAVVANRYDGIDFPGDDCRLLFIDGLPKATNSQERFLMTRMGAAVLFNERIQTRVLQAIGRCTRSLQDFSAVVVSGEELPDYLTNRRRRAYFHPELQAELEFGVEQSKGVTAEGVLENFDIFIENKEPWEEANQQILANRAIANQEPFPALDQLEAVVSDEIEYQKRLWQGDFETALDYAERVLGALTNPDLRGYRALWEYLAGSTAWLGAREDVSGFPGRARAHFARAKEAASGIPWLVVLSRYQPEGDVGGDDNATLMRQIERVEAVLAGLGTVHDRRFAKHEKEILEGLASAEKGPFEQAHKSLGELLGFDAGKVEADASPDPWWIADDICFVFEDHAGAKAESALDATKARQAATHPNWMRDNVQLTEHTQFIPVLVTPVTKAKVGAMPHLDDVALWPLKEFRDWAHSALTTIRELRRTFSEPGDLVWRAAAATAFEDAGLDAPGLFSRLQAQPAKDALTPTK